MRWLRAISGTVTTAFGLYFGYRAVDWVAGHDYVLALVSCFVAVAALRAGSLLLASEVAE